MNFELDQYFTPPKIADRLVASCEFSEIPEHCVDPACGQGDLLAAAYRAFDSSACTGLDKDPNAIARLKKRRPDWTLSVANLMQSRSYLRSRAVDVASTTDFVLVNPPFSQQATRTIESDFSGKVVKASFAMTYLMRSIEIFNPRLGGVAILPESSIYSDLDQNARVAIQSRFTCSVLFELDAHTFRGARARTIAVQLAPGRREEKFLSRLDGPLPMSATVQICRGTLPVHLAQLARHGIPYIHSTDIGRLTDGEPAKKYVSTQRPDVARGWVVLLPRVGMPKSNHLVPVFIKTDSRLSDCVIALVCESRQACSLVANAVKSQHPALEDLYRGTGARYVTVEKLRSWLVGIGIAASV